MSKTAKKPNPEKKLETQKVQKKSSGVTRNKTQNKSGVKKKITSGSKTNPMRNGQKTCSGCHKQFISETTHKLCPKCIERKAEQRAKAKENKIMCKGVTKNGPCKFEAKPEFDNEYCKKHGELNKKQGQKLRPGEHLCEGRYQCFPGVRGKKAILPADKKVCRECLDRDTEYRRNDTLKTRTENATLINKKSFKRRCLECKGLFGIYEMGITSNGAISPYCKADFERRQKKEADRNKRERTYTKPKRQPVFDDDEESVSESTTDDEPKLKPKLKPKPKSKKQSKSEKK